MGQKQPITKLCLNVKNTDMYGQSLRKNSARLVSSLTCKRGSVKMASSKKSRLEAHVGFFRLLMKVIFGPFVL